jgi:hypothetical protein
MMGPSSRTYPVRPDTIDWIQANFHWAIRHGLLTDQTPLVTLSKQFFTGPPSTSPDFVPHLVQDIKTILGIPKARIAVMPLDQLDAQFRHSYGQSAEVGGTWQGDRDEALIRYNPDHKTQPILLIATMAHEVMHHVLHSIYELPPGEAETEELATDLHCITTGFGLFQMNAAEQAGWSGYMRQETRAHALALFVRMRGLADADVLSQMAPRSAKAVRRALAWIDRHTPEHHNALRV